MQTTKQQSSNQKVRHCTYEDLKNDPEQLAIYKEIAEINLYFRKQEYEESLKNKRG